VGLRTSSWLAPSRFTNRPCDLPVEKTRDASDRYLPPKRTVCTRTSRIPGSARSFRCGDAPRSLRLRQAWPGDRTFHDVRDRFGGSTFDTNLAGDGLTALHTSVGVFFPRCGARSSLWHPCRDLRSSSRLLHFRGGCKLATRPPFGRFRAGRRMRRSPRPSLTPSRESRRLVMIRDTFRR